MAAEYFTGFPILKINPEDVYGSWKDFLDQFRIEISMKTVICGKRRVDGQEEDVFNDEMKKLALLKSVGIEGQRVIKSKGHSVTEDDMTYNQAMEILRAFYGREESIHVQTRNFVCASQTLGEDNREYLKRVEQLSRNLRFFNSETDEIHTALQTARESLALVIAVNGLKDHRVRKEVMAKREITWARLTEILTSRSRAEESEEKLGRPSSQNEIEIKREVAETRVVEQSRDRPSERRDYRDGYRSEYRDSRQGSRDTYYRPGKERSYRYRSTSRGRDNRSDSKDRYDSKRESREGRDRRGSSGEKYEGRKSCHECGSNYHIVRHCDQARCFKCGELGHISLDCGRIRGREPRGRESSPYPNRGRDSQAGYIREINSLPHELDERR